MLSPELFHQFEIKFSALFSSFDYIFYKKQNEEESFFVFVC